MDRKKELIMSYKETKIPMGVYQIKNKINGKVFVSKSPNLRGTENSFNFSVQMGSVRNHEVQKEWSEYGGDKFLFEILEYLEYEDDISNHDYLYDLKVLEKKWLDRLQPYDDKGYNKKKN